MVKSVIFVTIMMFVSKFLSLLKEILLAQKFGISAITDAYTVAISLNDVLFALFAVGFSGSYIPVFMRVKKEEREQFFNNVLNVLVIISMLISIICFICSEYITTILAPGFDIKTRLLTISFIKMMTFYLPFYTAFMMLSVHANAKELFLCSQFCELILINVIIIIFTELSSKNYNFLLYGRILSIVVAFVVLFINLKLKKEIDYRFFIKFNQKDLKKLCLLAIPFGLSSLVNQVNMIIDRVFSSSLNEGVVSALNYANKIQILPFSLIISVIITVYRPRINKFFAEKDMKTGLFYAKKAIEIAIYIALPISVLLLNFSFPIIKFLFERGAFDQSSTKMVGTCLSYYALGIPFYSYREVTNNVLAANYKQKTILKNAIIAVFFNIVLNSILIKVIDYRGLALSTSISGIISCILISFDLKKINLSLLHKKQGIDILKIIFSSIVASYICVNMYNILYKILSQQISLLLSLCIFSIVYSLITLLIKVEIIVYFFYELNLIVSKGEKR